MSVRLLMAARITDIEELSGRVRRLRFHPTYRERFPDITGGEHVQVQLADGTRRDYSLVSSPGEDYEIAVQREDQGRGGSRALHEADVGDAVFVSYPQSGMSIDETASNHLFIAGGIGVTSIVGLLRQLPSGARGRIHYSIRSRADSILVDRLKQTGLPVHVHTSAEGTRLNVDELLADATPDTAIYHCGPSSLMTAITAAAAQSVPVQSEAFVITAPAGQRRGDAFTARLVGTGADVTVAEDETLLHALLRAGANVDYSCEGGICGSCVIEAPSGDVDHRDRCLTEAERESRFLATCVSRGHGDISLLI